MEFKILEELNPNKEIIDILKEKCTYKVKKGKIKGIDHTNLKFIEPTEYLITKPIFLSVSEYKVNEINNKNFYIKEYNQKYNLHEIINILKKL